jgi:hypothetical protein
MFGKHESLREVNWTNLVKHVPEPELLRLFQGARFIALVKLDDAHQNDRHSPETTHPNRIKAERRAPLGFLRPC